MRIIRPRSRPANPGLLRTSHRSIESSRKPRSWRSHLGRQAAAKSNLLQTLIRHDLVDTLRIWHFPLVVGKGKRLFEVGEIVIFD